MHGHADVTGARLGNGKFLDLHGLADVVHPGGSHGRTHGVSSGMGAGDGANCGVVSGDLWEVWELWGVGQ
ncbi:hypothetical protein GCM10010307_21940 [Streptomyces vastus]|uniref:Uncharacterized protein n=1 Tax=Streptomyces vastus TaxID=285451 RepID=A0ABN3QN70_9ACTN